MPGYFSAYDVDGKSYEITEYPGGIGIISGAVRAVRIDTSTYIGVDGKVYSSNQSRSKEYSTQSNLDWAKREMIKHGFSARF